MFNILSEEFDVIVVGGGAAGIGAAIAASRHGAKTLLVERYGFLGGELVTGLAYLTFHDFNGRIVIGGIAQEIVEQLELMGATPGHLHVDDGQVYTVTYLDPEYFKYYVMEMLLKEKISILFHTFVVDVAKSNDKVVGVITESKSGRQMIRGKVIIDASGDGDVAAYAGAPYEKGAVGNGGMQAATLMFTLGGVELNRIPDVFRNKRAPGVTYGKKLGEQETSIIRIQGSLEYWDDKVMEMDLFPDKNHDIAINSIRDGVCNVNATRIVGVDATKVEDLTRAEIEGRRQAFKLLKLLKENVSGFENAYILSTAPHVGIRESRRIMGEYVLTEQDVLNGQDFPDGVARGSYCIDIHDPEGKGITFQYIKDKGSYMIPYRCLVPQKVGGLLVAGRCISMTHGALGSARVTAICTASGQAAGTAAALASRRGIDVREVDILNLQQLLTKDGVIL